MSQDYYCTLFHNIVLVNQAQPEQIAALKGLVIERRPVLVLLRSDLQKSR